MGFEEFRAERMTEKYPSRKKCKQYEFPELKDSEYKLQDLLSIYLEKFPEAKESEDTLQRVSEYVEGIERQGIFVNKGGKKDFIEFARNPHERITPFFTFDIVFADGSSLSIFQADSIEAYAYDGIAYRKISTYLNKEDDLQYVIDKRDLQHVLFVIEFEDNNGRRIEIYCGGLKLDILYLGSLRGDVFKVLYPGKYEIALQLDYMERDKARKQKDYKETKRYIGYHEGESQWLSISNGYEMHLCEVYRKKKPEIIIEGKYVKLTFHLTMEQSVAIAFAFLNDKYELIRLDNIPGDNISENYCVLIPQKNLSDIYFLDSLNFINGYAIDGQEIDSYLEGIPQDGSEITDIEFVGSKVYDICDEEIKKLYKRFGEEYVKNRLPDGMNNLVPKTIQRIELAAFIESHKTLSDIRKLKYPANQKQKYLDIARDNGYTQIRWKNEFKLYSIVKSIYKDAIFQYRCKWLELQSLDIYIPSLKLAIEYQGKQHYEAIEFFGGEESLESNKERDEKKKQKCIANGVRIIEWPYNRNVNKQELLMELSKYSVDK